MARCGVRDHRADPDLLGFGGDDGKRRPGLEQRDVRNLVDAKIGRSPTRCPDRSTLRTGSRPGLNGTEQPARSWHRIEGSRVDATRTLMQPIDAPYRGIGQKAAQEHHRGSTASNDCRWWDNC
jgi:hypothetical protein